MSNSTRMKLHALLQLLTFAALSAICDFLLCRKRNSSRTEAAEATADRLALGRARTLLNSTWRANITCGKKG